MEQRHCPVQHLVPEKAAHNRLRLRLWRFWLHPANDRQPPKRHIRLSVVPAEWPAIADALTVGQRQPHVVIAARSNSRELLFGYSDNREWHVVQFNRAADHIA